MGLGFNVVRDMSPAFRPIWVPVDSTSELYVGNIVRYSGVIGSSILTTGGVTKLVVSGAVGGAQYSVPFGVVIATNNATPLYHSSLTTALINVEYITGVDTAAAQIARDWRLAQSTLVPKGDPQPMVQVARITPDTVLKGYFRNSATVGTTVIPEQAVTTGATTGCTMDATLGFTGVADMATVTCTSGANRGLSRIRTDSGTSTWTCTREFPYTPAVGDKFKSVNLRQGMANLKLDTTYGLWIDTATTNSATVGYPIIVHEVNLLTDPGEEYCLFGFCVDNFFAQAVRIVS